MKFTGRYKIGFIGVKYFLLITDKHFYSTLQNNTALVKGMFMPSIFLVRTYFHAHHYQVITDFRLAINARSELL